MTNSLSRGALDALIGDSAPMRQVRSLIQLIGPTSLPVLIRGETGTGKELVARALHEASGRRGRFVAFNVCAISDTMFEDTLFGHVRGAFTGAVSASPGYVLEANGGTLFLDEISSLSAVAQAKLLRVIETQQFRPVGARTDRTSDFRVIAASNEALDVGESSMRRDLLYRLRGMTIDLPALRERKADIPELSAHFLHFREGERYIEPSALQALARHAWPGNVRQLRAVVEAAAALACTSGVTADDVTRALSLGQRVTGVARETRASFANRRLLEVLEQHEWDADAAAATLGVHRATIYRRIERLGQRGIIERDHAQGRPRGSALSATADAAGQVRE